jgi:hypothetical protein
MDDETMFMHLNARHLKDIGLRQKIDYSKVFMPGLVAAHRAFHRRLHALARPGQYQHEHVGEN